MAFYGLKLGLDLEMQAAHPHQKFQGVSPLGVTTTKNNFTWFLKTFSKVFSPSYRRSSESVGKGGKEIFGERREAEPSVAISFSKFPTWEHVCRP